MATIDPAQTFEVIDLTAAITPTGSDYLIIYQPSAPGTKLRRISKTNLEAAVRQLITTAESNAATALSTATLAIPLTQKAAANGVASLDSSGKVPASQLTIVNTSFKGNWNATTNSPALTDASGTGGDFYFVQSGASRDLGSGSIAWTTGALIIHNGTIWVENEAVNNVISVAGRTGAITLTDADITESTRYFLTSGENDALAAAQGTLSTTNRVVSKQELDSAVFGSITVRERLFTPAWCEDGTNESGTGANTTLSSLGYNSTTAAEQFPLTATEWGGITVASTNYDDAVLQETFLYMGANNISYVKLTGKQYNLLLPDGTLTLPKTFTGTTSSTSSLKFQIDGITTLRLRASGSGKTFLTREPSDETNSQAIVGTQVILSGLTFQGDSTTVKGVRICSTLNPHYYNCTFRNFTTAMELRCNLLATVEKCNFFGNTTSIYCDSGDWTDAAISTSLCQLQSIGNRFNIPASGTGINFTHGDSIAVGGGSFEGSSTAAAGVYIYNNSTVCKYGVIGIIPIHVEQDYSNAFVDIVASDIGSVTVKDIWQQTATWMVRLNNVSGTNTVRMENILFNNGGNTFKLRNMGAGNGCWAFNDVHLQGNPTTAANVVDTVTYPNIWDTSGSYTVPTVGRVKINPRLL